MHFFPAVSCPCTIGNGQSVVESEQLRVESGQEPLDFRDLLQCRCLPDRGEFLRSNEFRQIESRHVRFNHDVRRLNSERIETMVLHQ